MGLLSAETLKGNTNMTLQGDGSGADGGDVCLSQGYFSSPEAGSGEGVPHQGHRSMQVGSSPTVGPEKEGGKIMPTQLDLVGGSPELPFPKPAAPPGPWQIPIEERVLKSCLLL